jgi:DNA-binding transcriptional LysR family regulator
MSEAVIDFGLTDIVAQRYDAGIRLGKQVEKDMIAVRIGPDLRMAAVASPSYFAAHSRPKTPQDLTEHSCINIRLQTYGGLYAWEFEKNGRPLNVRVGGQIVCNSPAAVLSAALLGLGIAYLPEDMVRVHIAQKSLARVLGDWCPSFPGYHLYYPSKRQPHPPPLHCWSRRYVIERKNRDPRDETAQSRTIIRPKPRERFQRQGQAWQIVDPRLADCPEAWTRIHIAETAQADRDRGISRRRRSDV